MGASCANGTGAVSPAGPRPRRCTVCGGRRSRKSALALLVFWPIRGRVLLRRRGCRPGCAVLCRHFTGRFQGLELLRRGEQLLHGRVAEAAARVTIMATLAPLTAPPS